MSESQLSRASLLVTIIVNLLAVIGGVYLATSSLDNRLTRMEVKMDTVSRDIDKIEKRLDRIETRRTR